MPQTARVFYKGLAGRVKVNFNWAVISWDSIVLVSVAEYNFDADEPDHSPRFLGDANVAVESIAPHGPPFDPNNGVTFLVRVDWPTPIDVVADITVLDGPPLFIESQTYG
jgi:hypothetical protein